MQNHRWRRAVAATAGTLLLVGLTAGGCATRGFVETEVAELRAHTDSQYVVVRQDLDQVESRADRAFEKATLAERLALGSVEYDVVSTHQVQFAFDDWRLDDGAQVVLDDLSRKLDTHPRYVLEIRGHADATGTERYNYRLGRERAESVQRYLMTQHGVAASRVVVVSFGEDEPIASNDDFGGRAENRRVQVRLLDVQPQPEPVALDR